MQEWEKQFSEVVDTLAHEYGWTIEYIQRLDMREIESLLKAITRRKKAENGESVPDSNMSEVDALNKLINEGIAKKKE